MKKICLFILVSLFTISTMGQSRKGKIFLKNGSIVKGKITESESSETIHIQSSGNLWVFPLKEIEKIDYSMEKPKKEEPEVKSDFSNHTQIGILKGNSDNSQVAPFILHSSLNYKVDNKIQIGLGSGVEFLKETHLPVFANIEYQFRDAWFSPYLFFKAGYTFPIEDSRTLYYDIIPYYVFSSSIWPGNYYGNNELNAKGGVLLNPGFGFINRFSYNFGMSFSVGYRFSRLHYSGENDYRLDVDYNRLSVTLGFIFN
jgi:hypothetical protein